MNDLAEFLLARIKEDERDSFLSGPRDIRDPNPWDSARILAECEAKKQVLKWCTDAEQVYVPRFAISGDPLPDELIPGRLINPAGATVLRLLALPYADHPDYREEWRA